MDRATGIFSDMTEVAAVINRPTTIDKPEFMTMMLLGSGLNFVPAAGLSAKDVKKPATVSSPTYVKISAAWNRTPLVLLNHASAPGFVLWSSSTNSRLKLVLSLREVAVAPDVCISRQAARSVNQHMARPQAQSSNIGR
mmetsp:Transcript_68282/g.113034  ORF Transcript_68282/g.113034 Transcript_68282/m.113034 type:complete len:139 (-) Transcript_68282:55-471(-)